MTQGKGDGRARGRGKSRRWATRTAGVGLWIALGCVSYGTSTESYERGLSLLTEGQPRPAEVAFQTSCRVEDYGPGCTAAGRLHAEGRGVRRNGETALRLFFQGCFKGDPLACMELRQLDARGETRVRAPEKRADFEAAVRDYRRACFEGRPEGCLGAGVLTELGWGVDANAYNGRRLIRKACTMGSQPACAETGVGVNAP